MKARGAKKPRAAKRVGVVIIGDQEISIYLGRSHEIIVGCRGCEAPLVLTFGAKDLDGIVIATIGASHPPPFCEWFDRTEPEAVAGAYGEIDRGPHSRPS